MTQDTDFGPGSPASRKHTATLEAQREAVEQRRRPDGTVPAEDEDE